MLSVWKHLELLMLTYCLHILSATCIFKLNSEPDEAMRNWSKHIIETPLSETSTTQSIALHRSQGTNFFRALQLKRRQAKSRKQRACNDHLVSNAQELREVDLRLRSIKKNIKKHQEQQVPWSLQKWTTSRYNLRQFRYSLRQPQSCLAYPNCP